MKAQPVAGRACPACDNTTAERIFTSPSSEGGPGPWRLMRCRHCKQVFTAPLPSLDQLAQLYREGYYPSLEERLWSRDVLRILLHRSVLWRHRRLLRGLPAGRVLDVGCGDGSFLMDLSTRGWKALGTEPSDEGARLARARGLEVHQGELREARLPAEHFDVVTLWHVLEHLPEPRAELAEIHRILRPGGLLIVEVPSFASPTFRLCRQDWWCLDLPRHLQHFTPQSLSALLEAAGFIPRARQRFHHWDFTYTFYSFMARLGILRGVRTFGSAYRSAARGSRVLYVATGLPVAAFSLLYSLAVFLLSGRSETVTVAARKVPESSPVTTAA